MTHDIDANGNLRPIEPTPLPSPSRRREIDLERFHEERMAALTRGLPRVEGSKYRQSATKDNFGKWSCEEVSFVRGEDETLEEYRQRRQAELDWIDRDLSARNTDQYVNELHASAVQAGLRRLRDPEGVE